MMNEIDRIKQLGPLETYNVLILEPEAPENIKQTMRYGYLKPPIHIMMVNSLPVKAKQGYVIHKGRAFKIEKVFEDLEKRMIPAKKWLIKNAEDEPLANPRGMREEEEK